MFNLIRMISGALRYAALTLLIFSPAGADEGLQAAAPVWAAPPTTVVTSESRSFQNGEAVLQGTLYLPSGPGPFPAVVVLHSASSATRDLPLYEHLKDLLPNLGYAVLVYDRRGSGGSSGNRASADFNTLADDAIAGMKMLAMDKRIDAERIGFWGLSQGGWLSILAATRTDQAAFAVSVSAPLVTPDVQMKFAVENILRVKGFSNDEIEAAIATRQAVDDFMRGTGTRTAVEQRLAAAKDKPWFKYSYISPTLEDPARSQWAKEIALDPLETLAKVQCPTLILYGSEDPWVPVKLSSQILSNRASKSRALTYAVIASANHEMAVGVAHEKELDPEFATAIAPDAPSYFGILTKWLLEQKKTAGPR